MAWSKADKSKAMIVLAAHAGNASLAAQVLKEQHGFGQRLSGTDVRRWRTSECAAEYERIVADMPDMTSVVINETLETARLAAQAERLAIERTLADLNAGTCKDPARAARDLSHIKATNVEKFLTLSGRPTQIVEHQNPDDTLAQLIRDGIFTLAQGDDTGAVFDVPDEDVQELLQLPEETSSTSV